MNPKTHLKLVSASEGHSQFHSLSTTQSGSSPLLALHSYAGTDHPSNLNYLRGVEVRDTFQDPPKAA